MASYSSKCRIAASVLACGWLFCISSMESYSFKYRIAASVITCDWLFSTMESYSFKCRIAANYSRVIGCFQAWNLAELPPVIGCFELGFKHGILHADQCTHSCFVHSTEIRRQPFSVLSRPWLLCPSVPVTTRDGQTVCV